MPNAKKGKKKDTPLSSLNKAFGTAARFPSMQPVEFRTTLDDFKRKAKATKKRLGLTEDPFEPPVVDEDVKENLEYLWQKDHHMEYLAAIRDILLDSWYQEKRVYTVSNEMFDYFVHTFRVQELPFYLSPLLELLCKKAVYLEFPDNEKLQGVFCGLTWLTNEAITPVKGLLREPIFYGLLLEKSETYIYVHRHEGISVSDFFKEEETPEGIKTTMLALAYIGYMSGIKDAQDKVLTPRYRQGAMCWEVRKSPYPESIIDYKDPLGWSVNGLCSLFGYLSRENFLKSVEIYADRSCELSAGIYSGSMQCYDKCGSAMILEWEETRVIYQYDDDTAESFRDKYLDDILLNGISSQLLWYMPQQTILLFNRDHRTTTLISVREMAESSAKGIYILPLDADTPYLEVLPASEPLASCLEIEDTIEATCALYHILSVYHDRAVKKVQKDILLSGNPEKEELVPTYEPRNNFPQQHEGNALRTGEDIGYVPMPDIFDLTKRTVKRMPRPKAESGGGWHMIPHTRRPHPHRYWVGSGENKHMEVRYLNSIRIHPGERANRTTLKKLV